MINPILGYRLKDVSFLTTLTIPTSALGVEVQFHLRQLQDTGERESTGSDFRLCAFEDGHWLDICRGGIRIEYTSLTNEVDGDKSKIEQLNQYQEDCYDA